MGTWVTVMTREISRRGFLHSAAAVGTAAFLASSAKGEEVPKVPPLLDLHVHLDKSTIDEVLKLGQERNVHFGIVEHAGTKENKYPVVLSNDAELAAYLAMLDGKPVFKGVQAEWSDWATCFSPEMLKKLDFVLTDTMTFPAPDGHRQKLWEEGVDLGDQNTFMDRYVDWHLEILNRPPVNILANVSWLPQPFAADYEAHWTEARVLKVVEAAVKNKVALEISSSFQLPKLSFLKIAKQAGVKFTFGSNGRYPEMGKLDYSQEMAKALGLVAADFYVPGQA
jgi:histidinol phosphatase-like PHP family hydrolase